ncbi:MAG: hypothetical protein H8E44_04810 [Planctomycetes bacterium]|nr:hypothetical protein [Planctomycetota bacterium]MBL7038930.1 hypothetical protein [Pirellulaceae bacterium]
MSKAYRQQVWERGRFGLSTPLDGGLGATAEKAVRLGGRTMFIYPFGSVGCTIR